MPTSVLTRGRKIVARLTALAMVASIMVIGALPASAEIDTSATCPSSTPSAGFTDIAGQPAATQLAINCIADYGIAQGFTATTFVPQAEVSRWQMALFLTRQATVHGLTLGDGSDQGFTDISAYPAATQTAINQLAQLEITTGTTATTYSPADPVSRWQMALFLTRLLDAAGVTLGDGSDQGFTDIAAFPATTQTAINQIAQADVSEGFNATTFGPALNTLRSQMALFLTRTLAADNIVPASSVAFVTRFSGADNTADRYQVADANGCTTALVSYAATGTTFEINGATASKASFEAALTALAFPANVITASSTSTHHSITTGVTVGSGQVGSPNHTTTFNIVEPVTGSNLRTVTYNQAFDSYSVGGTGASLGGFNAAVSAADTVVITGGTGATAAQARTIALTNNAASGTVSTVADPNVTIDTACASHLVSTTAPAGDTFNYTVDGSTTTQAAFITAATSNDAVTYSRAAGVSTWALTNQAPAAVTGKVYKFDATNDTVSIAVSSTSAQDVNYAGVTTLRVDGVVETLTNFEAALTLADGIVFQADNPATAANESALSLTNDWFGGVASADPVGDDIILLINGQSSSPAISVTAIQPAAIRGNATTAPTYTVNGSSSTLAGFHAGVDLAIAGNGGSVTAIQSGTHLVWNVQTS